MANPTDSLGSLNSNLNYDLKNALDNFFGDDNDENSFINDNHSHLYYDLDSFASKCANNSNIFLSLNVCSLMSKHQNLSTVRTRSFSNLSQSRYIFIINILYG